MFGEETLRWGRTWDAWRELNRLQDEVNRLFSGALETRPTGSPAMRVWSNEEEAVLVAALPGTNPADIDISVLGDSVTLSGKRVFEEKKDVTYHRRERDVGPFTRTVQMPFRIESDHVQAEFHHGLLEVRLPRADADKPKRITVKVD